MRCNRERVKVMKQLWIDISLILLIIAAITAGAIYSNQRAAQQRFDGLEISITYPDSTMLIGEADVREMIKTSAMSQMLTTVDNIDTHLFEETFSANSYVDSVVVYKSRSGKLFINILQKAPLLRVVSSSGDFYIGHKGEYIPINYNHPCKVPIVTSDSLGLIDSIKYLVSNKKDSENYIFLDKLVTFVELLEKDKFWSRQIVQINLNNNNEVELVPRVGRHLILLCDINDIDMGWANIKKLEEFYKKVMDAQRWDDISLINLKYKDQVVCK